MPPAQGLNNHASARKNPAHVNKFLDKEVKLGVLTGPFTTPPFQAWFRNNPLMTRPKRNSDDLRVILDLSFPSGSNVNSHVDNQQLDGALFKLRLPSPLDLARLMVILGKGCKLYKIDLSRAYRQLRGDPLDWPLMGIDWEGGHYVDLAIPFGLRHRASACQRTSEAAASISAHKHGTKTHGYVDDTAGTALPKKADAHYQCLLCTFDELGLAVAPEKCAPPAYEMLWIGVLFNSLLMSRTGSGRRSRGVTSFLGLPESHCMGCRVSDSVKLIAL